MFYKIRRRKTRKMEKNKDVSNIYIGPNGVVYIYEAPSIASMIVQVGFIYTDKK